MFRIEWTTREPKAQAEIDELYGELLESIAIDGPHDFATLSCAARLLETRSVIARLIGYADRELPLGDADIVDFFESMDEALAALEGRRRGVLEFYLAFTPEYIVFDATGDQVRLFRVPWHKATEVDLEHPLPQHITAHPETTADRLALTAHLKDLRRDFAQAAIASDPRLATHEPLRRWMEPSRLVWVVGGDLGLVEADYCVY